MLRFPTFIPSPFYTGWRVSAIRLGPGQQQDVVSWSPSLYGFTDEARVGGISTIAASDGAAAAAISDERSRSGEAP